MAKFNLKNIKLDSKSIKVNAIFNSIYQILALIAPLITTPYISRVLGVEAIGSYQYCYSIMNYFMIVAAFGFTDYGTKRIAELRDDKEKRSNAFWEIMFSKGLISFLCIGVYFLITMLVFSGIEVEIFLALSFFIISILLDPTFYFQGREQFISITLRSAIIRILTIALIFILVKGPDDLILYALVLSGSNLLSALVFYFSFKGSISKPNFKELHIFEQFKKSFPFFLPALSVSILSSLNQTLLGSIGSNNIENGYYAQAVKFSNLIGSFVGSLSIIMFSRIAYLHSINDEQQAKKKITMSFHALRVVGLPCVLGICAVSKVLVPIFLGDGYDPVVNLIYIIAPIGILSPLNGLFCNAYFKAYNKVWHQTAVLIFAAVISILFNLLLIPKFGAVGCAIASLISELVQLPFYIVLSRKELNEKEIFKTIIKPLIASIIMFLVIFTIDQLFGNKLSIALALILYLILGIIFYISFILLFKDDFVLAILSQIINKFKSLFKGKKCGQ